MIEVYDAAATRSGFVLDVGQRQVAERLQHLAEQVESRRRWGKAPRGVYLWGPVGVGKSWLATVMFDALRTNCKRRVHFHEFFRQFHGAYARHRSSTRAVDLAVDEVLDGIHFLSFDEFHVHDAGDAMLISRLLRTLFARRITLLATSNVPPAGQLANPYFHHLVEPAVQAIEAALDVVYLPGRVDYRVGGVAGPPRSRFEQGWYLTPGTDAQLASIGLTPPRCEELQLLDVNGRRIRALAVRGDLVWFDVADLCGTHTSTVDYLALAERYSTWVLTGLTSPAAQDRALVQRFANLVDVLVDRDAQLVLTGAKTLDRLLTGDPLPLDAPRTISRLALLSTQPDHHHPVGTHQGAATPEGGT